MILLKCPNCNTEIEQDGVSDMTHGDDGIELSCVGYCSKCDKWYQWNKIGMVHSWIIEGLKEI